MGATIKVTVTNLDNVMKALNNLGDMIQHPDDKLMRRLGDTSIEDVEQRFMTRGYGTWAPLSEETIKRKHSDFVLIDSGAMFNSKTMELLQPGVVVVKVPYGGKKHDPRIPEFHQQGTSRMPQRKIIEKTPQLVNALARTLSMWVSDMIKAFSKRM